MSIIQIQNLSFTYNGSSESVFDNVSLQIDTEWKLGLSGRNGKGKTTLLKLLTETYEYTGTINHSTMFEYFPYTVEQEEADVLSIAYQINPYLEAWSLTKELSLLQLDKSILDRIYSSLSSGEKTKVLLAILFNKESSFLLIDEPTNHLDFEARLVVSNYLRKKKGYILVSHDRDFLDTCVDHMLVITRNNIEVQRGNFSSWWFNKEAQDQYDVTQNTKLKRAINRLEIAAKATSEWSDKVEVSKNVKVAGLKPDKGYIGHKSAKMMQRSKNIERRIDTAIEDKKGLLNNIEEKEDLKLFPLQFFQQTLIVVENLSIQYHQLPLFKDLNFKIENEDRINLRGINGCGKSSIIKALMHWDIPYTGTIQFNPQLIVSYLPQDTHHLKGSLKQFIVQNELDEPLFKAILRKLDFTREQFEIDLDAYSMGQKKKVLIAKSLSEKAHLYIWDEPLNYIDVYSRMQIEDLLLRFKPTLLFVEHDQSFCDTIATKIISL